MGYEYHKNLEGNDLHEPKKHNNNRHSENYATEDGNYSDLRARGTKKEDVGLSNVTNDEQATKTEFDSHKVYYTP